MPDLYFHPYIAQYCTDFDDVFDSTPFGHELVGRHFELYTHFSDKPATVIAALHDKVLIEYVVESNDTSALWILSTNTLKKYLTAHLDEIMPFQRSNVSYGRLSDKWLHSAVYYRQPWHGKPLRGKHFKSPAHALLYKKELLDN